MTRGVQKSSQVHGEKNRDIPHAEQGTSEYAWIVKMLGNGRVTVKNAEKIERLGIIRGSMRKRDWISVGDLVLVTLRGFQDDKVDIVFKYNDSEVRMLRKWGEIKDRQEDLGDDEKTAEDEAFAFQDGDDDLDLGAI
jgi:translation initiation factor 1A